MRARSRSSATAPLPAARGGGRRAVGGAGGGGFGLLEGRVRVGGRRRMGSRAASIALAAQLREFSAAAQRPCAGSVPGSHTWPRAHRCRTRCPIPPRTLPSSAATHGMNRPVCLNASGKHAARVGYAALRRDFCVERARSAAAPVGSVPCQVTNRVSCSADRARPQREPRVSRNRRRGKPSPRSAPM